MGRNVSVDTSLSASVAVSNINNPVTGVFGTGKVQIFPKSGVFTVPAGISSVRVRLWGGGQSGTHNSSGQGGGFALKTITGLTPGQTITATVASSSGTSSFGSYVSASTYGIGGDINSTGGLGGGQQFGGGGAGSVFGDGGNGGGGGSYANPPTAMGSGGGGGINQIGASGLSGNVYPTSYGYSNAQGVVASAGSKFTSIDFIGTGSGGSGPGYNNIFSATTGVNGGGGGAGYSNGNYQRGAAGGFPGGGGGSGYDYYSSQVPGGAGAPGLVIVEW